MSGLWGRECESKGQYPDSAGCAACENLASYFIPSILLCPVGIPRPGTLYSRPYLWSTRRQTLVVNFQALLETQ